LFFALFFVIIGVSIPLIQQFVLIPLLVEKYEGGYTIGTELELTYAKPFTTVYDLENGWTYVEQNGKSWLEKTVTYPHGMWPDFVKLNLATTEKYKENVEFRKFTDSNFGWIGPFPESFSTYGDFSSILFSVIGGMQTVLLILKKSKTEKEIMYFYEMHYVMIHHMKKSIFIKEKIVRKSNFIKSV
jgi:hypothetical protein